MIIKSNIILSVLALGAIFLLLACDDSQPAIKQPVPNVISKKISQPLIKAKKLEAKEIRKDKVLSHKKQIALTNETPAVLIQNTNVEKEEHYNAAGKIDPFKPLIQENTEETAASVVKDNRPKRILTPLEKIELTQIKLVAVVIMKNRQIAMVEDSNGKGYEVGIGTYIGKNQGRVSAIKDSSVMVNELVKDFKGRLREKTHEIKLHKNDSEE